MISRSFPLRSLVSSVSIVCALIAAFSVAGHVSNLFRSLVVAAIVISSLIEVRGWRRPPRFILNIIAVAALLLALSSLSFISIIEPFMEALLILIAVKLMDEKRARDHVQIVILSSLLVVCAAVLSQNPIFVGYFVVMSYLVGAAFLLSSMFAACPTLVLSSSVALSLLKRALAIWLMMLPLCLALFFFAPRARVMLTPQQYQRTTSLTSGFTDRIRHGEISRIQESDAVAFRVETEMIHPLFLYWRGLVLSSFDGKEWVSVSNPGRRPPVPSSSAAVSIIEQSFFLDTGSHRILFALDSPVFMEGEGIIYTGDNTYARAARPTRQFTYHAYSDISLIHSDLPLNERARRLNLSLPNDFSPKLFELVQELTAELDNEDDKIAVIRAYLSPPNFSYSLEGLPVTDNPLEQFIFETRRGNCEYFASAMAVMCRMVGIPARLVAGYRGGYYNETGNYYIVQQRNAHAWVETYNSEDGSWLRWDPTPPNNSIDEALAKSQPGFLGMYLDLLEYKLVQFVVEYSGDVQSAALERLQAFLFDPGASFAPLAGRAMSGIRALVLPTVALLSLSILLVLALKRRKNAKLSNEETLLKAYLAAMAKKGIPKPDYLGLTEYAEKIEDADLRQLASDFAALFQEDYYRDRAANKETIARLEDIIKGIIAAPRR